MSKKVYSVKFTLFINLVVAENKEDAIIKAKEYLLKDPVDWNKYKIEVVSEEK